MINRPHEWPLLSGTIATYVQLPNMNQPSVFSYWGPFHQFINEQVFWTTKLHWMVPLIGQFYNNVPQNGTRGFPLIFPQYYSTLGPVGIGSVLHLAKSHFQNYIVANWVLFGRELCCCGDTVTMTWKLRHTDLVVICGLVLRRSASFQEYPTWDSSLHNTF